MYYSQAILGVECDTSRIMLIVCILSSWEICVQHGLGRVGWGWGGPGWVGGVGLVGWVGCGDVSGVEWGDSPAQVFPQCLW